MLNSILNKLRANDGYYSHHKQTQTVTSVKIITANVTTNVPIVIY